MKDLCDVETPDERSVMTYVAEFFHKFSSEGRCDSWSTDANCIRQDGDGRSTGGEVCRAHAGYLVSTSEGRLLTIRTNKNDFERRMSLLLDSLDIIQTSWSSAVQPTNYRDAIGHLARFAEYKKTSKRGFVRERQELAALYSNIQTKLRTYALRPWEPREGLRLEVRSGHLQSG